MDRINAWTAAAGCIVLIPLWTVFAACCWCLGRMLRAAESFGLLEGE